jgi:ATP-dependent DNA helicase RecG
MPQRLDPRVTKLLELDEWQTFECKRARIKPGDALHPIIALANADGGLFTLGLEDPEKASGTERLYGISENPDNTSDLLNLVSRQITPQIAGLRHLEIPVRNRKGITDKLIVFVVPKSPEVHSTHDGDTYLRRGRHNRKLTAAEIIQLKYTKGELHLEDEPVLRATMDDLNSGLLEEFKNAVEAHEKNTMTFLRRNGLATMQGKSPVLNKAAVLLFGNNPAITLHAKCSIKVSVYSGIEAHFTDRPNLVDKPFTIEGPLLHQISGCLKYLINWRDHSAPVLEGGVFKPKYHYPDYAIQEAITNAVIHRDYSIQNDIQVRVFDDRIEFESPGRLAGHITLSNIRRERYARNPIILRTLNRFSQAPNLDIGEGVKRMFEAMKQAELIDPVYDAAPDRYMVKVSLYNDKRDLWEQVSGWLEEHGSINNAAFRRLTGEHDSVRASRLLHSLVDRGLIIPRGRGKRDRHYVSQTAEEPPSLFEEPEA